MPRRRPNQDERQPLLDLGRATRTFAVSEERSPIWLTFHSWELEKGFLRYLNRRCYKNSFRISLFLLLSFWLFTLFAGLQKFGCFDSRFISMPACAHTFLVAEAEGLFPNLFTLSVLGLFLFHFYMCSGELDERGTKISLPSFIAILRRVASLFCCCCRLGSRRVLGLSPSSAHKKSKTPRRSTSHSLLPSPQQGDTFFNGSPHSPVRRRLGSKSRSASEGMDQAQLSPHVSAHFNDSDRWIVQFPFSFLAYTVLVWGLLGPGLTLSLEENSRSCDVGALTKIERLRDNTFSKVSNTINRGPGQKRVGEGSEGGAWGYLQAWWGGDGEARSGNEGRRRGLAGAPDVSLYAPDSVELDGSPLDSILSAIGGKELGAPSPLRRRRLAAIEAEWCGLEGSDCPCDGGTVYYGGAHLLQEASDVTEEALSAHGYHAHGVEGSVVCSNEHLGVDPAPGQWPRGCKEGGSRELW